MKQNNEVNARLRFIPQGAGLSDSTLACPDCTSECSVTEISPGIIEAYVHHDPECPWLSQLDRDLA